MISRSLKFSFMLSVLVLLFTFSVSAQTDKKAVDTVSNLSGIEIETSVDRADIYIGDLITYKLSIVYDSVYELIPPPLGANLGAFDVKDYQSDLITKLDDGRIRSDNIFVLSTFTTGDYVIPPIPVFFNLPDGSRKVLLSEAVPIKVNSLLFNTDDSTDIKPLKAQFEFQRDYTWYYIWGGIIFILLVIIGLFVYRRMSKEKIKEEIVDNRPAWEIAFEKLALLSQKSLPQDSQFKQYYIELTEIVRSYYEKMYAINVLDMTTEEFLDAFKERELPGGLFEMTKSFFHHADLVKFAKFIPEVSRTKTDFNDAHEMIEVARVEYERRLRDEISIKQESQEELSVESGEEV